MAKKIPMRQCVGCGEMKNKKDLMRVLKTAEDSIVLDMTGRKNGRGAYLCMDKEYAFPFLTASSVANPPLTTFLERVASPSIDNTRSLFGLPCMFSLLKLLFQILINFLRDAHLKGTLQPFILPRLRQAFLIHTPCCD